MDGERSRKDKDREKEIEREIERDLELSIENIELSEIIRGPRDGSRYSGDFYAQVACL